MRKLYHANTGDDLIEGMFAHDGTLLGYWSPNDGYWADYFNPFMARLKFEVCEAPDWMVDKLYDVAIAEWGLTEDQIDRNHYK